MVEALKITFELEKADNPPLFQDLVQFPKGPRRVNRLRTLAHAGLIAQQAVPSMSSVASSSAGVLRDESTNEAALELFGPAVTE